MKKPKKHKTKRMEKNRGRMKMKNRTRGRPRKMSEEDNGIDQSYYMKGCGSAAVKRTLAGSSRPLTRYVKKLAAQDAEHSIPTLQIQTPAQNADRNSSELSTIMLVQQIVCGIKTPAAARDIPMVGLTSQSPLQAEIPIANESTPESNHSIEELIPGHSVNISNHQILEDTVSTASTASTEELMPDPPVLDHAYQESHSSLALRNHPFQSEISSPNDTQIPPISSHEQKLSVPLDHRLDSDNIISGLLQIQQNVPTVIPMETISSQTPVPIQDPPQHNNSFGQPLGHDLPSLAAPTLSEIVAENQMVVNYANLPSNCKPEISTVHANTTYSARSVSLNMTQMVNLLYDEYSDSDDIESGLNNSLVEVNGYKVQREPGPILKAIMDKYGDIAERSSFSMETRSCHLEMVCRIYKNLEASKFKYLMDEDLERMLKQTDDLRILQLEVGWLHSQLIEISEVKQLCSDVSSLKEERTRNHQVIEEKRRTMEESKARLHRCVKALEHSRKELESWVEIFKELKEECSREEDGLAAAQAEKDEINEKFLITKAKFRKFYDRSLVNGLV